LTLLTNVAYCGGMAKARRAVGRPADTSKIAVYCRIDRQAVADLDTIADEMDPKPSRAQLIDRAVREFTGRNRPKGKVRQQAG
jgi:hypothetical protein